MLATSVKDLVPQHIAVDAAASVELKLTYLLPARQGTRGVGSPSIIVTRKRFDGDLAEHVRSVGMRRAKGLTGFQQVNRGELRFGDGTSGVVDTCRFSEGRMDIIQHYVYRVDASVLTTVMATAEHDSADALKSALDELVASFRA